MPDKCPNGDEEKRKLDRRHDGGGKCRGLVDISKEDLEKVGIFHHVTHPRPEGHQRRGIPELLLAPFRETACREEHRAAGLPNGERRLDVLVEEELLDGGLIRLVLLDQRAKIAME